MGIHPAALESNQNIADVLGWDGASLPPECSRPLLTLECKVSELRSNSIQRDLWR